MLQFLSTPRSILIVEDKISFALQLTAHLESEGHTVICYEGVQSCEEATVVGINPLTKSSPPAIRMDQIDCAFLDHYFAGRAFDGTSLCKVLAPAGTRVVGMSSVEHANHSMIRAGAMIAMRKDLIMNWIRAK